MKLFVLLVCLFLTVYKTQSKCPKAGLIPVYGKCAIDCTTHKDCKMDFFCCKNQCGGSECMHPTKISSIRKKKHIKCPDAKLISVKGRCTIDCASDNDCDGELFCCKNQCGGAECMHPAKQSLVKNILNIQTVFLF